LHIPAGHLIDAYDTLRATCELSPHHTDIWEFTIVLLFQSSPSNQFIDRLIAGEKADINALITSPIENYFC